MTYNPLSAEVEHMLDNGARPPDVARELGLSYWQVRRIVLRWRRLRAAAQRAAREAEAVARYQDDLRAN